MRQQEDTKKRKKKSVKTCRVVIGEGWGDNKDSEIELIQRC